MRKINPKIIRRNPNIKRVSIPVRPKSIKTSSLKGIELINSLSKSQRTLMKPNFNFKFDNIKKDKLYIIGGGPSVLQLDLTKLVDGDTMVINKAIEYVDNPTYFLTMDYTFINSKININNLNKAKYKIFILNTVNSIKEHKGVYYDSRFGMVYEKMFLFDKVYKSNYTIAPDTGFGLNEKFFAHGENSGFSGLQAGILMGYKEIILIGFDLSVTNKTHFHNGYGQNLGVFVKKLTRYFQHYQNALRILPNNIKNKIFITSKRSKLLGLLNYKNIKYSNEIKLPFTKEIVLPDTTNTEVLDKSMNTLNDLIVVGYYTINTPYEQEAKKSIASCKKFNLNYDIIGIKNLGGWQANTRYKAQFMINMLKKHKNKRLLYIDVDAMFHESPVLFKNYKCDIAVRWQNFRWRQNECLSGTIYMENNKKTMKLCKMWLEINNKQGSNAKTFEQWNLGTAIETMRKTDKLNDKNLPPEYCQFDLIERIYPELKKGLGVIQHYQLSRKFKGLV